MVIKGMLYLYDIGLRDSLKSVFDRTYLSERTKLFKKIRNSMTAGNVGDIKLPVIGIWRIDNSLESDRKNFAEFNSGFRLGEGTSSSVKVAKAINLTLMYQIDILAGSMKDADDMLCDVVMYFRENPIITFSKSGFSFHFALDITDLSITTDLDSQEESGMIYSHTLNAQINEARMIYIEDKSLVNTIITDLYVDDAYLSEDIVSDV
jgi:hypothetical protein